MADPSPPVDVAPGRLSGLSTEEARRRLAGGGNQITAAVPRSLVARVWAQVSDPLVLVLVAAAVLTTSTGDWADTAIIAIVIVTNTAMGLVQEGRAERAIEALSAMTAPTAVVVRDGEPARITVADVVPGDLVLLAAGDLVPADGRLEEAHRMALDESALTGESLPVERAPGHQLTAGTAVVRGRGRLVVTATGDASGLGQLARLVREAPTTRTPLQRRTAGLSRVLAGAVLLLVVPVVVTGLLTGRSVEEMLVVGASLAVAAVPESLPAVVGISLALGAHRMARHGAVVRRLPAVETLGSVTVVATDKTGTLTEGRLVAEELWTPDPGTGAGSRLGRDLVLCNDAVEHGDGAGLEIEGDPFDTALLRAALGAGIDAVAVRRTWRRVGEEPFEAATRCMVTRHAGPDGRALDVVKGGPEAVADRLGREDATVARTRADHLAAQGRRVLVVADRDGGPDAPWRLAGVVAVSDPPRESARDVVTAMHRAGVRVALVTGDHPETAHDIARRVGVLPTDDDQDVVFARVLPAEKVDIVQRFQAAGEVVAMLGDGVNDAPALRHADIGVAAGQHGTEVARQAADLVLMDDELGTVVEAIREGRRIFANLRSFLVYAVSGGLAELGVMLVGPVAGLPLPLLPGQILWINLLTHGLTGVAFGAEPADPADMSRPPIAPTASVLTRRQVGLLAVVAALLVATALLLGAQAPTRLSSTVVFLTLGLGQLGVALALRSRVPRRRSEQGLLVAVGIAVALMFVATYVPGPQDLLRTEGLGAGWLAAVVLLAAVPGVVTRTLVPRSTPVRP